MITKHSHTATNQFTRPCHSQQVVQVYNTGVHSINQASKQASKSKIRSGKLDKHSNGAEKEYKNIYNT